MVEDDWSRSAQGQYKPSYTEHDAAIDRAIAETYGGSTAALRDADANRPVTQKTPQLRTTKSGQGFSYPAAKREASRGQSATRPSTSKQAKTASGKPTEKEKWIHRDKLAQIEVQEYREAGLEPPQELLRRLAESRAGTRRDDAEALRDIKTPDERDDDIYEEAGTDGNGYHRYPEDTAVLQDEQSHFVSEDGYHPEETAVEAVDEAPITSYSHVRTKSGSRLPVSVASPPIQQDTLRQEAEADSIGYPKIRARKGSVGNPGIPNEPGTPTTPSTLPGSPNKSRIPSTKMKEKGKGKFNTISNVPKIRSTSASRPGTSDGRPRTATNPPEGDPPWLAGMYKPDPRLPPDQQILPTHAKRIAQEQWEREGKNAKTFDRDFNPIDNFDDTNETLAAEKVRGQSVTPDDVGSHPPPEDRTTNGLGVGGYPDGEWPLTSSRTPSPSKKRMNGGGYTTTPRITDSPKPAVGLFPSPRPGDQPAVENGRPITRHGPAQQPNSPMGLGIETRVSGGLDPEKGEEGETKKKKKAGCGCCVVM